jgi:uncharacterized protein YhbP (UPF0306 family)
VQKECINFIKEHHILTICTCKESLSWCASCFYAYDEKNTLLIFSSDEKTKHANMMRENPNISGTIALETKEIGLIQGMQFSGMVSKANSNSKKLYFKTYPYAIALIPTLWQIEINYAKLTNNRLGFGKKLEFNSPKYKNLELFC